MAKTDSARRKAIFEFLFRGLSGYLHIAAKSVPQGWEDHFYKLPHDLHKAVEYIDKHEVEKNFYFCPNLFTITRAKKENIVESPCVWADLDGDSFLLDSLLVEPTLVFQTSEGKYHVFWRFHEAVNAVDAERISKNIAYFHRDDGADVSGWDMTQLLRIPYTYNFKYDEPQLVKVTVSKPHNKYKISDFRDYPDVGNGADHEELPNDLPEASAEAILEEYKKTLNPRAYDLFSGDPGNDWSNRLWSLERGLFEAGMSKEEVFVIVRESACNKYARDNRPENFLWKEVVKASGYVDDSPLITVKADHPELISDDEREWANKQQGFVEDYIEWAKDLTDASWQYHQAGAFIVLSTLLTGAVRLPTSFGILLPNLWFMILADTTLTRKSTAMDIAVELLSDVDSDAILATDGSIEGLLTSLSMRPGRPSVFLRDEFTGLMEMINKRDYYSGMLETFTKLYDGKFMRRLLKRETIEVREPILILFAGGIKSRMTELLTYQHVSSGFLPRFVFITAEADVTKLKPIGPPTAASTGRRDELVARLTAMREYYWAKTKGSVTGNKVTMPKHWNAELTPDAWVRYNRIEVTMQDAAMNHSLPELMTPAMDRLAKSGLKAAVLIAADRSMGEDKLVVTEEDLVRAFCFVEQWRDHTHYIIENVGTTSDERKLQKVYRYIVRKPQCSKAEVLRAFKFSAREGDAVLSTLEQRDLIRSRPVKGRGHRYEALEA